MKKRDLTLTGLVLLAGLAIAYSVTSPSGSASAKPGRSQGATDVSMVKLPSSAGGVGVGLTKLASEPK